MLASDQNGRSCVVASGEIWLGQINHEGELSHVRSLIIASLALFTGFATHAVAESPADLNDLEIAHVAYTADSMDIRYAHLALAISSNPAVRDFARTMIRDHSAVNEQALALVEKLNVAPQDNFLSRQLNIRADQLVDEMSQLRGEVFDRRYAENELGYHQAVNGLVECNFILMTTLAIGCQKTSEDVNYGCLPGSYGIF